MDGGIEASENYTSYLIEKLKITTQPISLSVHDAASLLMGKCNLSQRGYKHLRKVLYVKNIQLPTYEKVVEYVKSIDIGQIFGLEQCDDESMCARTKLQDTLQHILDSELFVIFEYVDTIQQGNLFRFLKSKDKELYSNLHNDRRTIFLRQTGDNFRGAARYPTEQVSFSVLNMKKMVNSPYGQFINALWRGTENREGLSLHLATYFTDVENAVKNGIELSIEGRIENFNVIVFLCTDLGFLEKALGKCSTTSTFGCFWCIKRIQSWAESIPDAANHQTIKQMIEDGEEALQTLDSTCSRSSTQFVKFQQSHYGQYVSLPY